MQKYIVITPFFPTKDFFQGAFIYDQVCAIKATNKYEVLVFKPSTNFTHEDYDFEGIRVFRFKSYSLPSGILSGLFDKISVTSLLKKLQELQINIFDIAFVHVNTIGLGFYANALKKINPQVKTILQHHGFDVLCLDIGRFSRFQWHRNYVKRYGVNICNQIDLHVGVSAKLLECLSAYPEIEIKNSYVLYNGVGTNKFYQIPNFKDNSIFKIGCIANFWELKDQITLIKAVEILIHKDYTDIQVEFIGSGITYQKCVDYVNEHSLQKYFSFYKERKHNELILFYNSLDLFVLPSYYEAFGCVYTEAYACGVPFIAVKGQGIAELIAPKDKEKWLIDKQDYKMLAKLIAQYREKRYSQQLQKPYTIEVLIKKFLQYISEL